ncbi:MAG: haloacid dehalogenase-like hydrolase [Chloroflexi bacterium]|nr:haloacid dehalogenase-like hydrolase [Chloroflexota bacterium]
MSVRLIDCNPSDFSKFSASDLVESIRNSEGRVVMSEVIATAPPLIDKVSNVEMAAAFGADLVLLNLYDVYAPQIMGMPSKNAAEEKLGFGQTSPGFGRTIRDVKEWIGRPVGLNLEPIENPKAITTQGRLATVQNALLAVEQGADFIMVTGNPGTGVTLEGILKSLREIKSAVGNSAVIMAGKMHAAGTGETAADFDHIQAFIEAGAQIIGIPAPGTTPGMTTEIAKTLIEAIHRAGGLALTAFGTSQEGSTVHIIEQIALMSKMAGADIHHIGDAGTIGMAVPENITALSMAIRGRRHTWHRMAASLKR